MPHKTLEGARLWQKKYIARRSRQQNRRVAQLEERILTLIRRDPGRHTLLTLYAILQKRGYPIGVVQRALGDLRKGGALKMTADGYLDLAGTRPKNPFALVDEDEMG